MFSLIKNYKQTLVIRKIQNKIINFWSFSVTNITNFVCRYLHIFSGIKALLVKLL